MNILKQYGFLSIPNKSPTENFNNAIKSISNNNSNYNTNQLYRLQPKNLSVHNLCPNTSLPLGVHNLLGLGLKYCISTARASPNTNECLKKLAYKIRTTQYLLGKNDTNTEPYNPQIYIKLKGWNPPPATSDIEKRITAFEHYIKKAITENKLQKHNFSNLTHPQKQALQFLIQHKEFIILPTDKNLGPAIMKRDEYIKQCFSEHLLTSNYKQLCKQTAYAKLESVKYFLKECVNLHRAQLNPSEVTYFTRSFKLQNRIPIFYGLPKIHKNPITLRPVVSCINSFTSIFSNWLDYKMKDLLFLIPSYIKDSKQLLSELTQLTLPPEAKLFTADATAMYTNIDTATGVKAFEHLFETYEAHIPHTFPKELFLKVLKTIMENNIFKFSDTYWIQTKGTAMGTPAAPLYSIITFGYHENNTILKNFKSNLIYYKRFIDDIFGIWLENPNDNYTQCDQWHNFKHQLNSFGSLNWNIEPPTTSTTFLDLTINIKNKKLQTKTYQKPLNLYLYIPPLSAHPPSCFKGLVTGELYRYWLQNSDKRDFIEITIQFILRLLKRGHQLDDIIPLLKTAAANIDNRNTHSKTDDPNADNTLYIHWKYHPGDIGNRHIREIYNNTLRNNDGFQHMRLAVSRPKNLRDLLCKSDLPTIPGQDASDIQKKLKD